MREKRMQEIIKEAEKLYEKLVSSIIEIPDFTIDYLPEEKAKGFVHGGFYEFTKYRKHFGSRLIFICLKNSEGQPFFIERLRMYSKEGPQGIERADDPIYLKGVSESIYIRIPEGSTIFDIGCGTGKYLKALKKRRLTILAMDISKELIEENKKSEELSHVNFFTGDCTDLSFLKDKEIDYVTGVNILNILYPEMVESLLEQLTRVASNGLFAFTLPARADMWSNDLLKMAEFDKERLNKAEYLEKASNNTFLGQMRFLMFIRKLCKEKGWRCRIFRFLDSITLKGTQFNKMIDARYLKSPENMILKLLEFPIRKAAYMQRLQEGSCHIYALGYGVEIFFDNEHASPIENAFYFDEEVELDKLSIRSELNDSIRYWNLSFEKLD